MFSMEVGEINTHGQTVYTRPSPPPILEGLGTRLLMNIPAQCITPPTEEWQQDNLELLFSYDDIHVDKCWNHKVVFISCHN